MDPEVGVADSGNLENDLPELFIRIGEAAKAAGKAWPLLIDEVQYLSEKDLAALIVSLHKITQKKLAVLFFGAGLPQVAALSGDAKSYAERLFHYPEVGALSDDDAKAAIRQPISDEGANIADALDETPQSLGPRRAQIISKGMIYSPSHGDVAFTVPMFNDYLLRNLENLG
ncbi:hypothetical protein ACMHYO_12525 [Allopusillimonas ginsengisoli]|uniref:hypothetical protein n=1 Tax=Allopusillimonas ginsengisoli TaxID=453575 RepID=UPI0026D76622